MNILVAGTPGVGKTSLAERLAERLPNYTHIDVAKLVRTEKLYEEFDDEMDCSVFDDEKVLAALEPKLEHGRQIVDFHSTGFLPAEHFGLAVVLRTDNTVLWDRLAKRGYAEEKVKENVECEIFRTVLDEVQEMFTDHEDIQILELVNDELSQMDGHVEAIAALVERAEASAVQS